MKHKRLKLFGIAAVSFLLVFIWGVNDFLAINRPVDEANILVVEGWIWKSSAMKEVVEIFNHGHYKWLVTVGEPTDSNDGTNNYISSAELAARRLKDLNIGKNFIIVLPAPKVELHKTYTCALTLRKWLILSKIHATGINVFSLGTHARKSLVLYQRALGKRFKVGVFAGTDDSFDPNYWWLSKRGIYVIGKKTLGYLYAVFWPLQY